MAIIYTYSNVTPEPKDLLVITDVSDNNYTKSSTITAAIAATIAAGQNIWFTTSGTGVITINSADFTLSGQNNAFVPRKWGTVLTKDDNGALTTTFSSIRAIQTGEFIEFDNETIKHYTGFEGEIPEIMKEKLGMIQVDEHQYLLKNWIRFQYNELKENVSTHKRIIERLRRKGLDQHFPELQEDF